MSGVQFSLAGYLTVYLVDADGFSKTTAGTALSVAFASACVGRIAWGWLSDRWFDSHATTLVADSGDEHRRDRRDGQRRLRRLAVADRGPDRAQLAWLERRLHGADHRAGHREGLGRTTGRGLTAIYAGAACVPPLIGAIKDVTDSWPVAWGVAIGAVLLAGAVLVGTSRRVVGAA